MRHKISLVYSYIVKLSMCWLPDVPSLMRLRGFAYSFGMNSCGRNFQVSSSATIRGLEKISCENDVYIGPNAFLLARESIELCSEVLIAMNVVIVDGNHAKSNNSYRYSRGRQKKIKIGSGSWIAANSVITAGSEIPEGTLVPPCTVVRES